MTKSPEAGRQGRGRTPPRSNSTSSRIPSASRSTWRACRGSRQGGGRMGSAARARRGARQRRRAGRRHGQDLLEALGILAVRPGARARSADPAVLRLHERLGEHHPPRRRQPRRDGRGCRHAGARRQALPGSRMGQERLLRFPQADLSRHRALGGRPRRACRRARRADQAQGRLLREADRQRDLAVELHPHQSGAVPRDGRLGGREPGARHAHAGRGHPGRQGRPQAQAVGQFALRGRQEPGDHAGQGGRAQRRRRDHPVRAGDRDGAEAAAADLPAMDQQVLHPRPQPGKILHPLGGRAGPHGVRHLLGQPRRTARHARAGRPISAKASSTGSTSSRRRPASARSTPSAIASAARCWRRRWR